MKNSQIVLAISCGFGLFAAVILFDLLSSRETPSLEPQAHAAIETADEPIVSEKPILEPEPEPIEIEEPEPEPEPVPPRTDAEFEADYRKFIEDTYANAVRMERLSPSTFVGRSVEESFVGAGRQWHRDGRADSTYVDMQRRMKIAVRIFGDWLEEAGVSYWLDLETAQQRFAKGAYLEKQGL